MFFTLDEADYINVERNVSFTGQNLTECLDIAVINDSVEEGLENFLVEIQLLSNPTRHTILNPNVSTITIVDESGERDW